MHGIADLKGLVIGVQQGNTSQPVADRLVAEHRAARVRVYAYDEIETALDDLSTGGCDAFMKLAPVAEWFVRDRHRLKVVATGITRERLGVCVRKGNTVLREAIGNAQAVLIAEWHASRADRTVARDGGDGSPVRMACTWRGLGRECPRPSACTHARQPDIEAHSTVSPPCRYNAAPPKRQAVDGRRSAAPRLQGVRGRNRRAQQVAKDVRVVSAWPKRILPLGEFMVHAAGWAQMRIYPTPAIAGTSNSRSVSCTYRRILSGHAVG